MLTPKSDQLEPTWDECSTLGEVLLKLLKAGKRGEVAKIMEHFSKEKKRQYRDFLRARLKEGNKLAMRGERV